MVTVLLGGHFGPEKKQISPPTLSATPSQRRCAPPRLPSSEPPPSLYFQIKVTPPFRLGLFLPFPAPKTLLCLLSRRILCIFFPWLPGNFALKNGGDFWWISSGLRLPRNEARKILEKFGENLEQNSGQNSGRKFEKFGKLPFCNFPDLTKQKKIKNIRNVRP